METVKQRLNGETIQQQQQYQDDYGVLNSEDEFDQDTQSMEENEEEEEETTAHLIKAFGSTFHSEYQEEIQEATNQQGLSPRGRSQGKQSKQNPVEYGQGYLKKMHNLSLIAILEPFSDNDLLNNYRIQLNMDKATCKPNGKIWLLWNVETDEQHITCRFIILTGTFPGAPLVTSFNVITSTEEKQGGVPYNMNKSFEFLSVIEDCGLLDLGYNGSHFTWCNQRTEEARVWKRLDRAMVNDQWLENMPQSTISHLPFVGSDHCPLLLEMAVRMNQNTKYLKFLHFWTEHSNFLHIVKACCDRESNGNPMGKLHQKMKRLSTTLSNWSKQEFGDIFSTVKSYEDRVRIAEEEMLQNNSQASRAKLHQLNVDYIKYLKLESSILKQKTQLHWFREGDANSKYFHVVMRGRRKKLFIHKICTDNKEWVQGDDNIAKTACTHFQHIFSGHENRIVEGILQCIPRMITPEQNQKLQGMPTMEELQQVVYSMNLNSAPGPDGFGGKLYQVCWDIIKHDILEAVKSFFCGSIMPKFMSHACLVLLPKVEHPNKFNEFRPISLSNFTNKIISKLLCLRLAPILPLLISENQSGFVRGRSISENIMLAQEINHGIKKANEGDNVVIKFDMAKAYDRVSWSFTCLVPRKMGFGETFIDLVWRVMSNNWCRVLSRRLNLLYQNPGYKGFQMEIRGPEINHLSFEDDIIIFTSTTRSSLQFIMETLNTYEEVSDQLINKAKSHFMAPTNTPSDVILLIEEITGFSQKSSPITYLGCPLYIGRQRIIYYSELVAKVVKKISDWQSRILSFGGKATLIKHVLQSIPIHTMAAISPPKTTIRYIKRVTADFFWGWDNEKRKYHWASWENLSFPYEEGDIGVRQLEDVCTSMQFKQWWTFRSKNTLWGDFLRDKYCQRAHPVGKKLDTGQSLVWNYMMKNKSIMEPQITWRINSGTCSFWWDDWTGEGPLAYQCSEINSLNNTTVAHFLLEGKWNETLVRQSVPPLLVPKVLSFQFHYLAETVDVPVWKPTENGLFSCASAWEFVRRKREKNQFNAKIWHKNVSFKIPFLTWRALRFKLPANDKLISFGKDPADCYCCHRPGLDSIDHIFMSGQVASYNWRFFSAAFGIFHNHSSVKNLLINWWGMEAKNEVKKLCAVKYGGKHSNTSRVIFLIIKDTAQFLYTAFPYIHWPYNWHAIFSKIENCKHEMKIREVKWERPPDSIYKLNTDGSALNNPGKIGGGGILRDHQGQMVYAFTIALGMGTNNMAETQAAAHGLYWCLQHGFKNVILEVDSELLAKWITHIIKPPWRIQHQVQELNQAYQPVRVFSMQTHIQRSKQHCRFPGQAQS
ncbi:uncharacterized protein [Solanum tuberosum]|uniref:uncharacterized protein n=1 Tax=Solanum tuberosum TaxID=4113 RepID=UPI00073A4D62|nr:PREDICTED: uncharacterized protein LOC107062471 [Solanum tuberosum]